MADEYINAWSATKAFIEDLTLWPLSPLQAMTSAVATRAFSIAAY